jgi:disulfide bond formation protein DsbB
MNALYSQRDPSLILDLAREKLNRQIDGADAITSKTGLFFGVGSTLTGILVALLAFRKVSGWIPAVLVVVAVVAYLVMTVCSLFVFRKAKWKVGPSLDEVATDWAASTDAAVALRISRTFQEAISLNEDSYGRKIAGLSIALWCLFIQTLVLLVLGGFAALGPTP